MHPVFLDIMEPDPVLESIDTGSLFGVLLGIGIVITIVILAVLAIIFFIKKRRKK